MLILCHNQFDAVTRTSQLNYKFRCLHLIHLAESYFDRPKPWLQLQIYALHYLVNSYIQVAIHVTTTSVNRANGETAGSFMTRTGVTHAHITLDCTLYFSFIYEHPLCKELSVPLRNVVWYFSRRCIRVVLFFCYIFVVMCVFNYF